MVTSDCLHLRCQSSIRFTVNTFASRSHCNKKERPLLFPYHDKTSFQKEQLEVALLLFDNIDPTDNG